MKKVLFVLFAANCALASVAQVKTAVTEFNIAGPYAVAAPFGVDTVDVQGKKFDPNSLMSAIALTSQPTGKFSGQVLPSLADSKSVGLLSFYLNNSSYLKGKIEVKGPKHSKLYIDGVEAGSELKLAPEHHTFTIQYLAEPKDTDSIKVTIESQLSIVNYQLSTVNYQLPSGPWRCHRVAQSVFRHCQPSRTRCFLTSRRHYQIRGCSATRHHAH